MLSFCLEEVRIQKQDPYICCLHETHFRSRDTYRLKVRGWKNVFHANGNQKKAGVAILISDKIDFKIKTVGTSLVAQRLRICLPMQGTRVRSLVRVDPTCRGATKPVHHNYWAHVPQLRKPVRLEPVLRNKKSHSNEKPAHCNEE